MGWWPSYRIPIFHSSNFRHKTVLISQSYVTTDGQLASLSWCQAPSRAQNQIFVTVRQLWVCWCGAPSLTRGWVCHLQLLMVLASTVILRSESHRTQDYVYCFRFETPPTWGARSPYLYLPGTRWPNYTPIATQSHITTNSQSASWLWCQTPSGAQDHIFVDCYKDNWSLLYSPSMECTGNTSSHNSSIVVFLLSSQQPAVTWHIQGHSLATAVSTGFTVLAFSRHATICITRKCNTFNK
jgi:hypothetical protein